MSIITQQYWDGVTPPALPTGWTYDSGFATSTAHASPLSSPNLLIAATSAVNSTAYYSTTDLNSGNVIVSGGFTAYAGGGSGTTGDARGSIFARGSSPSPAAGATYYRAQLNLCTGSVVLYRYVAGATTILASLSGSFIGAYASPYGTWFILQLICNGSLILVNVQRVSDSQWLQTDGTWGPTAGNCLTVTDTVITGSGYAGLVLYNDNNGADGSSVADAAHDNFLLQALNPPLPQIYPSPNRTPPFMTPY